MSGGGGIFKKETHYDTWTFQQNKITIVLKHNVHVRNQHLCPIFGWVQLFMCCIYVVCSASNSNEHHHDRIADMCPETDTLDSDTGNIYWPPVVVGYHISLRCPYSVYTAAFASRECQLNGTGVAWSEADLTACPGTPLLQELAKVM